MLLWISTGADISCHSLPVYLYPPVNAERPPQLLEWLYSEWHCVVKEHWGRMGFSVCTWASSRLIMKQNAFPGCASLCQVWALRRHSPFVICTEKKTQWRYASSCVFSSVSQADSSVQMELNVICQTAVEDVTAGKRCPRCNSWSGVNGVLTG